MPSQFCTRVLHLGFVGAIVSFGAQQGIPVRDAIPIAATDSGVISTVSSIRALSDGRVFVSDLTQHRVVLFDSALKRFTRVLGNDSASTAQYGRLPVQLIAYLGDSTVVADGNARTFVVIDPAGKIVHAMAAVNATDLRNIGTVGTNGRPAFDLRGRLIYRSFRSPPRASEPKVEPDSGTLTISSALDSAPIVRADFDARVIDTIGMLHIAALRTATLWLGTSRGSRVRASTSVYNPLPTGDDWTVTADGTVALVRGHDYHIDWLGPDGTRRSSPKMPFDWRVLTASEKQRLLDSAVKAHEYLAAHLPPGESVDTVIGFITVKIDDLPDYYPPLRAGQVRADLEGNVWIMPSTSSLSSTTSAGLIFDVVDPAGAILKRVRLPEGRALAGFGPNVLYLTHVTGPANRRTTILERARIPK